jgi:hypothetical protein
MSHTKYPSPTPSTYSFSKGNLDPDHLFEALCASFNPDKLPVACGNHVIEDKKNKEVNVTHKKGKITLSIIVLILLGLFLGFTYVFYKRKIKRELSGEMGNQV